MRIRRCLSPSSYCLGRRVSRLPSPATALPSSVQRVIAHTNAPTARPRPATSRTKGATSPRGLLGEIRTSSALGVAFCRLIASPSGRRSPRRTRPASAESMGVPAASLTLVGKAMFTAVAVFVVGHVVLIAAFHAAWMRLKEQYPATVPAAGAEARGEIEATPPYEQRRTSAVRSFRKREATPA